MNKRKRYSCSFCDIEGHNIINCPNKICNICKNINHYENKCPKQICTNCNIIGHHIDFCPTIQCLKCLNIGHTKNYCKILKCINCKELNHIKKNCPLLIINIENLNNINNNNNNNNNNELVIDNNNNNIENNNNNNIEINKNNIICINCKKINDHEFIDCKKYNSELEKEYLINNNFDNYDALKYNNEFEKLSSFTICCMCAIEDNNMQLKINHIDLINKSTISEFYKTIIKDLNESEHSYDHEYANSMELEFTDGLLNNIETICISCIKEMKRLINLKNKKGINFKYI